MASKCRGREAFLARGWAKAIDIGDWGIITRRGWVPLSLTAVGASCELLS